MEPLREFQINLYGYFSVTVKWICVLSAKFDEAVKKKNHWKNTGKSGNFVSLEKCLPFTKLCSCSPLPEKFVSYSNSWTASQIKNYSLPRKANKTSPCTRWHNACHLPNCVHVHSFLPGLWCQDWDDIYIPSTLTVALILSSCWFQAE